MIYTHSPKAICIGGPPAAGKSTAAQRLVDEFGYAFIPLDSVNAQIAKKLGITVGDLEYPHPQIVAEFKTVLLQRVRDVRFSNIVLEGCRISHPHVYEAFVRSIKFAYGEYAIVKGFFLDPPMEQRVQQYLLRQAQLAKKAARDGDRAALQLLEHQNDKGFSERTFPALPGFEVVESVDAVVEYAEKAQTMTHPDLPSAHADLIKFIAESGAGNPFYQQVDVDGKMIIEGFTNSDKSWDNIQQFNVDFHGKKVCDIGCMLGFYTFKVEEEGGEAVGVDIDEGAVRAAQEIAKSRKSSARFMVFNSESPFEEDFDFILALNVLHRVDDFKKVCSNIFESAREVIVEVGEVQLRELFLLSKQFGMKMVKTVKSHRNSKVVGQRVLVHFVKQ